MKEKEATEQSSGTAELFGENRSMSHNESAGPHLLRGSLLHQQIHNRSSLIGYYPLPDLSDDLDVLPVSLSKL
jgi:hypothetical protein